MKELFAGIWTWAVFSTEKNLDFNGFLVLLCHILS